MHSGILRTVFVHVVGLISSIVLGIVGGALCGAAILAFGGLIGRSCTTGAEYIGYWESAELWVGSMYGAPLGAIAGALAYATLVHTIGFRRAIVPATLGTLAGGFLGSLACPPTAVLTGILGFFCALIWTRYRLNPK